MSFYGMRRQFRQGRKQQGHFQRRSAISWGLKPSLSSPLNPEKWVWVCQSPWGQGVDSEKNSKRLSMCSFGIGGFKGPVHCSECTVSLLCSFSDEAFWLHDSGAWWHFLIGFPSQSMVSIPAQQKQGHNHSWQACLYNVHIQRRQTLPILFVFSVCCCIVSLNIHIHWYDYRFCVEKNKTVSQSILHVLV